MTSAQKNIHDIWESIRGRVKAFDRFPFLCDAYRDDNNETAALLLEWFMKNDRVPNYYRPSQDWSFGIWVGTTYIMNEMYIDEQEYLDHRYDHLPYGFSEYGVHFLATYSQSSCYQKAVRNFCELTEQERKRILKIKIKPIASFAMKGGQICENGKPVKMKKGIIISQSQS